VDVSIVMAVVAGNAIWWALVATVRCAAWFWNN